MHKEYDNVLLVVLNPRNNLDQIQNYAALSKVCPVVAIRGYSESEACRVFNQIVRLMHYDYYVLTVDDVVGSIIPFRFMLESLDDVCSDGQMVLTGWSNMYPGSDRVNVAFRPRDRWYDVLAYDLLRYVPSRFVKGLKAKGFPKYREIVGSWADPSHYLMLGTVGWSMTAAHRSLWREFPLYTRGGRGSDWVFSRAVVRRGLRIVTHTDLFFYHLDDGFSPRFGKVDRGVWVLGKDDMNPDEVYETHLENVGF